MFIATADAVVDSVSDAIASIPSATVDVATGYLAAHFLAITPVGDASKQVRRETLGDRYSVEYLTPFNMGDGVLATQYGQTANLLLRGALTEMDKRPVSMHVLGGL